MRQFVLRAPEHAHSMVAYVKAHAGAMAAAGKPMVVSIAAYKEKRSLEQNACLHAILASISEQAVVNGRQYDAECWKEMVRRRFIGTEEIDLPDGSRIERGISTTSLGVGEFADLITAVQAWSQTELGVEI